MNPASETSTQNGYGQKNLFDQRVIKRSLNIAGHSTSISLEQIFWDELKAISNATDQPVSKLVTEIDALRGGVNLSSALRVFILQTAKAQAAAGAPHKSYPNGPEY